MSSDWSLSYPHCGSGAGKLLALPPLLSLVLPPQVLPVNTPVKKKGTGNWEVQLMT